MWLNRFLTPARIKPPYCWVSAQHWQTALQASASHTPLGWLLVCLPHEAWVSAWQHWATTPTTRPWVWWPANHDAPHAGHQQQRHLRQTLTHQSSGVVLVSQVQSNAVLNLLNTTPWGANTSIIQLGWQPEPNTTLPTECPQRLWQLHNNAPTPITPYEQHKALSASTLMSRFAKQVNATLGPHIVVMPSTEALVAIREKHDGHGPGMHAPLLYLNNTLPFLEALSRIDAMTKTAHAVLWATADWASLLATHPHAQQWHWHLWESPTGKIPLWAKGLPQCHTYCVATPLRPFLETVVQSFANR